MKEARSIRIRESTEALEFQRATARIQRLYPCLVFIGSAGTAGP